MKNQQNKAFSLIELSIVLIIIGLLIAGIVGGKALINTAGLSSARALTNSSPVAGTENLELWLETTSKKSFNSAQPSDSEEILVWKDINPQRSSKTNATTATGPAYKKSALNGLPALNFDGVNDFFNFDGSILVNTPFTIFIVEQRTTGGAVIIIGSDPIGEGVGFSYYGVGGAAIDIALQGDSASSFSLGAYTTPVTRIHRMIRNSPGGDFMLYVNGSLLINTSSLPVVTSFSDARIGRGYDTGLDYSYVGNIGEIIMFNRGLSDIEIEDIEKYLSKKWKVKLN